MTQQLRQASLAHGDDRPLPTTDDISGSPDDYTILALDTYFGS